MIWTTQAPITEGWYWFSGTINHGRPPLITVTARIVRVTRGSASLWLSGAEVCDCDTARLNAYEAHNLLHVDGQWAGSLEPPE